MWFLAPALLKKDTVETNACAKEKIVNKTWCHFSVWHELYDGVAWNKRCCHFWGLLSTL
jgi:hypothetical protein